jgi:hypothetical protein
MHNPSSIKSTAHRVSSTTSFKPRVRRLGPGRYLVESQSRPGVGHPVTADHCLCKGFSYRGICRHVVIVRALEPSMVAWYDQATPPAAPVTVPMSAGAPSGIKRPVMGQPVSTIDNALDDADRRLGAAYRALADAHEQSDERAVLLRQVDGLERLVAALSSSAIRAA